MDVYKFGLPYFNDGHVSEEWLLRNKAIIGTTTLLDILKQKRFRFVVSTPAETVRKNLEPFRVIEPHQHPYGTDHRWDIERNDSQYYVLRTRVPPDSHLQEQQ